jgi:hypothetical protein
MVKMGQERVRRRCKNVPRSEEGKGEASRERWLEKYGSSKTHGSDGGSESSRCDIERSTLLGRSSGRRRVPGGGGLCLDDAKVHLNLFHFKRDILRGVHRLGAELNQANVHVVAKNTRLDEVGDELPQVSLYPVLVLGRDPRVDSLLLVLLVEARVERVFDSRKRVLGRLCVESLVTDGGNTSPNRRPNHDFKCSGRGVHRVGAVAVDEHVERNVGLGANGLEGGRLVGGVGIGCRVHVPGSADVEVLDIVQSAGQLYGLKTDVRVRVNLVHTSQQGGGGAVDSDRRSSHTQTSRSVHCQVTLKEAASLESSSPT